MIDTRIHLRHRNCLIQCPAQENDPLQKKMAIASASQFSIPSHVVASVVSFHSHLVSNCRLSSLDQISSTWQISIPPLKNHILSSNNSVITSSLRHKSFRDPRLDKHVVKQKRIRFIQKLKTLLLSKPKHFIPIPILYKCRSYLSVPRPNSLISMIHRYPTIFELFTIPAPPTPLNAAGWLTQLCVRLTPAASELAKREMELKKRMAVSLAAKLQKLLMLASPHHRILLSKLVHLCPDLGLPVNFRSRLCNDHPTMFKVVETSYGRALELVSWDSNLADAIPSQHETESRGLIVDRPLKFKHLKLRKGLNVKRQHHDYLIKFNELPDVCPYTTDTRNLTKESIEAEKRACALVREVLGMTIERRTLVDHLTHFRKEFGLPNRLRAMLVRHPELFYVSIKGQRDSVFLVEGYSEKGKVLEKDELLMLKYELMELVREGRKIMREKRRESSLDNAEKRNAQPHLDGRVLVHNDFDEYEDGLDDLFEEEESSFEDYQSDDTNGWLEEEEFWTSSLQENGEESVSAPW